MLPEFLRLPLRSPDKASPLSEAGGSSDSPATSSGSAHSPPGPPGTTPPGQRPPGGPFCTPLPPAPHAQEGATHIWKRQSREVEATAIQTVEDHLAELTLVGEGDIGSPNSTLLPPPPSPQDTPGPPQPGTSTF